MAKLPFDKIQAAEKIQEEVDAFKSKRKKGSAVAAAAEKYGLNRTTAQNYLKLLTLSQGAQRHVSLGNLAMRNALAILKAPASRQDHFADLAVNSRLNREEIYQKILLTANPVIEKARSRGKAETNPDIKVLVESISENLSTPIRIENEEDGDSGVIIVDVYFLHVFTAILGDTHQLGKCKCQVESNIDLSKPDQQKGFVKFFFNNKVQKYNSIALLASAAKKVKQM